MATPEQMAYAAGLFDGEGTVWLREKKQGVSAAAGLGVGMTDREPLDLLVECLGGKVYGPYAPQKAGWKPRYYWRLDGWVAIERVYAEMGHWLCPRRRRRFEEVIAASPPLNKRGGGVHERLKTHCKQGHPYDEVNTYWYRDGHARGCKECRRAAWRKHDRARRERQPT